MMNKGSGASGESVWLDNLTKHVEVQLRSAQRAESFYAWMASGEGWNAFERYCAGVAQEG